MNKKLSTKAKEPIRLRAKQLSNGNQSLYLDIYRDGKRVYEFLKLYLIPEKTKADKDQNKETLRTANAIKAQKIVAMQNGTFGFSVDNKAKSKINFIQYLEAQAQAYEERGSKSYARSIRNSIYHLRKYKGDAVTLKQVDKAYLLGYIDFLSTTNSRYGKPLSKSVKALYFNIVNIALNKAVRDEYLLMNPASKIDHRPKQGETTRQYLTFDEVQSMAVTPCKDEAVKRAFMFACFCGLRFSDIVSVEWWKIKKVKGGEVRLEIKQQKTGEPLYLPLSPNAVQWLPKKNGAKGDAKVFVLPHLATVERHLKQWSRAAGIEKHVTFHVARHTNATLMLSFGADIYTVSKLLGHTNVKTTQIYAKVVDENKRKAVNLIPQINIG